MEVTLPIDWVDNWDNLYVADKYLCRRIWHCSLFLNGTNDTRPFGRLPDWLLEF